MKNLLLIFVFLFPITSYAEWLKFEKDIGETVYIEINSIKQNNGYFYYWTLTDFEKPNPDFKGALSIKTLWEADCSEPRRIKTLSGTTYKSQMGQGKYNATGKYIVKKINNEWKVKDFGESDDSYSVETAECKIFSGETLSMQCKTMLGGFNFNEDILRFVKTTMNDTDQTT